jgi:cystathionine beta-lyase/cystathionine gamma-synthase
MSVEQIQALADGLAGRLGRAVVVDDRELRLVAASADFGDADPARVWSLLNRRTRPEDVRLEEIARLTQPGYVPENPALELWQRLCVPIRHRGMLVGFAWITDRFGDLLEECLAALDGGACAVAFASGMAASATVIAALARSGAHVVIPDNVYGGTWDLVHEVYQRWGLAYTAVDMGDLDAVAALRPQTALVWTETPSNPLLKITDIAAVAALAHEAGALLVTDSTFASPYLQQPIALGADLVVHSTTKYLGGHSDVTGGAVIAASFDVGAEIARHAGMLGTGAASQDSWLVQRGIKTLPVRMRQICANSQAITEFLAAHPLVRKVHYPGLPATRTTCWRSSRCRGGSAG